MCLTSCQTYSNWIQESPTLDLANDCSRFVTGYFEIISASAPHIYHSALVSTPKTSVVRKLYESHLHPFVRVVHGALISWDSNTATKTRPSHVEVAVWSQCGRFIAIAQHRTAMVDVLDSAALQRLQTLELPQGISTFWRALVFSPGGLVLTCSSHNSSDSGQELFVVSWDLQTGGTVSVIRQQVPDINTMGTPSVTYSIDGKMVGVFVWCFSSSTIFVYDVVSGVHVNSHSLSDPFSNGGPISNGLWAHGESFRFATAGRKAITIWEVGFAPGTTPVEVETLSIPHKVRSAVPLHNDYDNLTERVRFLPGSYRLAIAHDGRVLVWDVRNSKSLLSRTDIKCHPMMTFSSDGRFFACSTIWYEMYLWKESPTGYVLHEILASSTGRPDLLLSPNGESIVAFGDRTIRLWCTESFTTPPSSTSTEAPRRTGDFILDFSPDAALAAVVRREDNAVKVFDLTSGTPQLTIDAGAKVYGIKVTGSAVAIAGDRKVITWVLPTGDRVQNARVSVEDSARTINFISPGKGIVVTASISADLHHVALVTHAFPKFRRLYIYSASTEEYLGHHITSGSTPWFTPDGRDVWCAAGSGEAEVWTITRQGPSPPHGAPDVVDIEHPPVGYPWGSSRGYKTTNDGWVLGPDGKRLLMLPPPWQSYALRRVWNGRFLALLHGALLEPAILELDL